MKTRFAVPHSILGERQPACFPFPRSDAELLGWLLALLLASPASELRAVRSWLAASGFGLRAPNRTAPWQRHNFLALHHHQHTNTTSSDPELVRNRRRTAAAPPPHRHRTATAPPPCREGIRPFYSSLVY